MESNGRCKMAKKAVDALVDTHSLSFAQEGEFVT
jgi:hypothetical protein